MEYSGSKAQSKWAWSIMKDFKKMADIDDPQSQLCLDIFDSNLIIDFRDSLSVGNPAPLIDHLNPIRIESKGFDEYTMFLTEKSRPPSRGGNTSAMHNHRIVFNGEPYYFIARGSQQWVYKSDLVTFWYYEKGNTKIILPGTLVTIGKDGKEVIRGNRTVKRVLRTADTRLPCSRRHARD